MRTSSRLILDGNVNQDPAGPGRHELSVLAPPRAAGRTEGSVIHQNMGGEEARAAWRQFLMISTPRG